MLMTKLSVLVVTDDRLYNGFFKLVSSLFQSRGQTDPHRQICTRELSRTLILDSVTFSASSEIMSVLLKVSLKRLLFSCRFMKQI